MKERHAPVRQDCRGNAGERSDCDNSVHRLQTRRGGQRLAGMAEGRAAHDGQGHDADGADGPGVNPGARCDTADGGKRIQQEAKGHEGKAHMQDQDEAVGDRAIAGPACEANRVGDACRGEESGGRSPVGPDRPQEEARGAQHHAGDVEPIERRRQTAGILPCQPVPGEARHDAPAHDHDEKDDKADAEARGIGRDTLDVRLEVEREVGHRQQGEHRHDLEVAPVLAGDDLARDGGGHQGQEGDVDQRGGEPADLRRKGDRDTAGEPDQDQDEQWPALKRQAPGPVGDRREQKAGDDRRHIAEQHFVHMPVDAGEGRPERQLALEHRQPRQDFQPGIDRPQQEERSEAVGKQGRPRIGTQTGNLGHHELLIDAHDIFPGSASSYDPHTRTSNASLATMARWRSDRPPTRSRSR